MLGYGELLIWATIIWILSGAYLWFLFQKYVYDFFIEMDMISYYYGFIIANIGMIILGFILLSVPKIVELLNKKYVKKPCK